MLNCTNKAACLHIGWILVIILHNRGTVVFKRKDRYLMLQKLALRAKIAKTERHKLLLQAM